MKNQPLLVSVLIGLTVIFLILGASLVATVSNVKKQYSEESSRCFALEEQKETLQAKITLLEKEKAGLNEKSQTLEGVVKGLQAEIGNLKVEMEKMRKIKDVFEEKLKEELIKEDQPMAPAPQE